MYSWGITLMVVGALSFILPVLGRQFIVVSALGLTGMGSALAGIVLFGVGLALFNAARTKESEAMARLLSIPGVTPPEKAVTSSVAEPSPPQDAQASLSLAQFFCQLTVNAPNQEFFDRIVGLCAGITEGEKARLRICITVAHATMFVWYFRQMVGMFGSDFQRQYAEALILELAKTDFEVLLEDYVVLEEGRTAFLSEHAERYRTTVAPDGMHRIHVSDLILGLVTIRLDSFSTLLRADMEAETEGFQLPFMKASHFVVHRFLGKDPAEAPYGGILAMAIGQELAATLSGASKALAEAVESKKQATTTCSSSLGCRLTVRSKMTLRERRSLAHFTANVSCHE